VSDSQSKETVEGTAANESAAVHANSSQHTNRRFVFREERFFLVLAVFIGIFAGLSVVCFRIAIERTRLGVLGSALSVSGARVILAPALAGLVIAVLVIHLFPGARGSGVNQTKAALYIYNGYIPFRTAIGKFITSALAIGSGHSLGPEDPSLQIGATLASVMGRKLSLSREKLRLIAPVGAAAGLAAAFNAPISAVLFVIEEVIGRWNAGVLGAVVLSAISSVVIVRSFLGSEPLFRVPPVSLVSPRELVAYALLGIVGGLAALVFTASICYLRPKLRALPSWTHYFQPAAAGLLIGCIGYLGAPQVMGAGYEFIDQAMHNQYTWQILGILAALKILATTLSFVSGTPGGMFAPTLFVGAMLGACVGVIERTFFPALTGSTATYALVGMGVLFAGFLRAPMTSVFMVLEVSGNYSIIIPVMVANTIAYLISRAFQPVPIFDVLTRQDGVELPSMEELREEQILRVEDAMRPYHAPVLGSTATVRYALERIRGSTEKLLLIREADGTLSSLPQATLQAVAQQDGNLMLDSLPHRPCPVLYPDNTIELALRRVHGHDILPVVNRANHRILEGVVSLENILETYRLMGGTEAVSMGAGSVEAPAVESG